MSHPFQTASDVRKEGFDLSKIEPLTEAEADAYFGQPSAREKYEAALVTVGGHPDAVQDIVRYVALLQQRLSRAGQLVHQAEERLLSIRDSLG